MHLGSQDPRPQGHWRTVHVVHHRLRAHHHRGPPGAGPARRHVQHARDRGTGQRHSTQPVHAGAGAAARGTDKEGLDRGAAAAPHPQHPNPQQDGAAPQQHLQRRAHQPPGRGHGQERDDALLEQVQHHRQHGQRVQCGQRPVGCAASAGTVRGGGAVHHTRQPVAADHVGRVPAAR